MPVVGLCPAQAFRYRSAPFRSSELWDDNEFSAVVHELEPLDLVLFNAAERSWGAHVAVYLGDGVVAHLSRHIGLPEVRTVEEMLRTPKYRVLVGAKRIKPPNRSGGPRVRSQASGGAGAF